MGLLSQGAPLSWKETIKYAEHVRRHGIQQFIHIYHKLKNRQDNCLKWGDEIEYMLVRFDEEQKKVRVSNRAEEIFAITDQWETEQKENREFLWRPEFAAYMVEGTPGKPYGEAECHSESFAHFSKVELNMRNRRKEMESLLKEGEELLTITAFPRLGCDDFCTSPVKLMPSQSLSGSIFFPDECIFNGHPRFKTLVSNIRARRGRKVAINIPRFKDTKTPEPFIEQFDHYHEESAIASKPDHVYMDAMGFGMGCCCLQVTFQASNLDEARCLYDQLTALCPIMMALSAATPIQRGSLTERDCRWDVVSMAVDDRTKEELGEVPMKACDCACNQPKLEAQLFADPSRGQNVSYNPVRTCSKCGGIHYRIAKSRYDSIDCYISAQGAQYNDIPITYNVDYYKQMVDAGVDPLISRHIAHLFIRDPICVYEEKLKQDDANESDHFENIQSTNWQTMRFKPPPPNSSIGWRVEFRPLEVQMTEFENAAYVTFIVLLTRVILTYKLNLLIPISKVDENMAEAQKRDAVSRCKFWFRREIITQKSPPEANSCVEAVGCCSDELREKQQPDESCQLMTLDEVVNGKGKKFPGLVPLLRSYLASIELDAKTHCCLHQYLNLISNRSSGRCQTNAKWIRQFVQSHPDYKQDSIVSEQINYDLLCKVRQITKGEFVPPELLGNLMPRV